MNIYSWQQSLKQNLNRYKIYSEENQILKQLRDTDLKNPAPFSSQTLIIMDNMGAHQFEKPNGFSALSSPIEEIIVDIPITKIIGISCSGNLNNFSEGFTFREVLFECLHGDGINDKSVRFLMGSKLKNQNMPHERNPENPKSYSKGPLRLIQYGEWFIVSNGQQRAIVAMYAIWQAFGKNGLLKNVTITRNKVL